MKTAKNTPLKIYNISCIFSVTVQCSPIVQGVMVPCLPQFLVTWGSLSMSYKKFHYKRDGTAHISHLSGARCKFLPLHSWRVVESSVLQTEYASKPRTKIRYNLLTFQHNILNKHEAHFTSNYRRESAGCLSAVYALMVY